MASNAFTYILTEKIAQLRKSFSNTAELIFKDQDGRLFHPGEFGSLREDLCKELCQMFTPDTFKVADGFIIDNSDFMSTQCDLIIYDIEYTPKIEYANKIRFYPIETVAAVGEVKSTLSKNDFIKALKKLAAIKKQRENLTPTTILRPKIENGRKYEFMGLELNSGYNPDKFCWQQMPTFLICKKLDFNFKEILDQFDELYGTDFPPKYHHNLILSFEDGLFTYIEDFKPETKSFNVTHYPVVGQKRLDNTMLTSKNNLHIYQFLEHYYNLLVFSTILMPNMISYLPKVPTGYDLIMENKQAKIEE
jgi:hypothetical protein